MLMIFDDFFDSVWKRKGKYSLFLVQMILIFLMVQYSFQLVTEYMAFNQKLNEIDSGKILTYFAFQDQNSEEMPDCTLQEYKNFKREINQLCKNTAFSFGVSDIELKENNIPDAFTAFEDSGSHYYQVTYISENFLNYYQAATAQGKSFSKKDYERQSSQHIPVLLGSDYGKYVKVGELLDGKYKVIGILREGASYLDAQLNSNIVSLDRQIVIPMIYQAQEWGGCYVNHLTFSTHDSSAIKEIEIVIRKYGFQDYSIHSMKEQISILRADFWTELSFIVVLFLVLSMLCIFSMISMLLHLIEEQKKEFGIHMLCGASRSDICIKIVLPVGVILVLASIPSVIRCESVNQYLFQFAVILFITFTVTIVPLMYWLKKPISELKKER